MLWVDFLDHWLHVMAAIIWVGGMLFTGLILTPVARRDLPPQVRYPLFKAVGERFALIGRIALVILILTGIYKVSQIGDLGEFFGSHPGKVLELKICLVVVMIAISLVHDFVWGPRLIRLSADSRSPEYRKTLARLAFWSRVNMVLVLAIVFLGVYLRINPF